VCGRIAGAQTSDGIRHGRRDLVLTAYGIDGDELAFVFAAEVRPDRTGEDVLRDESDFFAG